MSDSILNLINTLRQYLDSKTCLLTISLICIFFRILVGLGPYSGYKQSPKYGDYEAQRHWMELTVNLNPKEWYVQTLDNSFDYWRIDYPPLSAYVSLIFGYISQYLDPQSMILFYSRGYEDYNHKIFMRMSVIACDVLVFFTSLYKVYQIEMQKYGFTTRNALFFVALMCPPLILIDHGHFQYNCFLHGLTLWAIYFCCKGQVLVGGIIFTLGINFKQMGLYYALSFFSFILGYLSFDSGFKSRVLIIFVGFGVILTTVILWIPWITNGYLLQQLIEAIFPINRGLYQLKVANFWCFSNIFIKWNNYFNQQTLVYISIFLTLILSLPSMFVILNRPKFKYMRFCLFNISMSFFFFVSCT
ncbi:hypothetical protein IMG5_185760 [Ichthyophthirius multifiliis]|uniref:Alpha-1,3-glucosyltransferase n=1 Tax=Ichthyophthirius multifiliis TaxID=5932 RepID=G0R3K4_ICHMU|nr:hypothetical protein IMG5_185760 [Ichthyophthirius multifiliis]EGR27993.1 hypothetical protein IMG5_185760 [Ichthyophthirius multifiliis]|eukprot:XP_004027338.1 hypothetical protein IMG5_185760 [Ichthyophthirius multifiliis]